MDPLDNEEEIPPTQQPLDQEVEATQHPEQSAREFEVKRNDGGEELIVYATDQEDSQVELYSSYRQLSQISAMESHYSSDRFKRRALLEAQAKTLTVNASHNNAGEFMSPRQKRPREEEDDGEDEATKKEDVPPPRPCPCGAGPCSVFTSNTEKNPGRKFYKCPLGKNGGCSFFEWCDETGKPKPAKLHQSPAGVNNNNNAASPVAAAAAGHNQTAAGPSPNAANRALGNNAAAANHANAPPVRNCPCGAGPCSVFTSNTEKNPGRKFYKCPMGKNGGCSFFEWVDEAGKPKLQLVGNGGGAYTAGGWRASGGYVRPVGGVGNYGRR